MKAQKLNQLWLLAVILGLLAGVGGYTTWQLQNPGQDAATVGYQTATVKSGGIAQTASGTGTLKAGNPLGLAFGISGRVAEVRVQEGDFVKAGDVLAQLEGNDVLNLDVNAKTIALQTAEYDLQAALQSGGKNLAQALLDLSKAQASYDEAQTNLHRKGDPRCRQNKTETYYYAYLYAQRMVNIWESYLSDGNTGFGHDYMLSQLYPARRERDNAYINWKYCEGYTDAEILNSEVTLSVAKSKMDYADGVYQKLKADAGLDTQEIAILEGQVKTARLELAAAQADLRGSQIVAPVDGMVIAVSGAAGEIGGASTFITLADPDQPEVKINMDEVDFSNIQVGCQAVVVFDALPGRIYTGTVTEIYPALVSVTETRPTVVMAPEFNSANLTGSGYSQIGGTVKLNEEMKIVGKYIPLGLKAAVDISCNPEKDVLLVPTEAVHKVDNGAYVVNVLNAQGQPEQRTVEMGLQSGIYSEIKSGVKEGELVITTYVEAQK